MKKLFYKIKGSVLSWFSDIRIYKGGFILWGPSSYKIKGHHMRNILNLIRPGDVLLRRYDHYIGSIFIPGFWSHAALYVGKGKVLHMLGDGITCEDILTFMRTDHILILRNVSLFARKNAISEAWRLFEEHVEYDYDFDNKSLRKLYCTEFVDVCYGNVVRAHSKNKYILPDDFLKVSQFKKIWSSTEKN